MRLITKYGNPDGTFLKASPAQMVAAEAKAEAKKIMPDNERVTARKRRTRFGQRLTRLSGRTSEIWPTHHVAGNELYPAKSYHR